MKRFLCMILTVAMLISGIPAVFAENDANSIGAVTEQEAISDNQDEITKDNAEEISGEGEENSEEQISLMSEENDVSLLANETNEVQYSTDNGSTWTSSTFDNIWSEAEKITNKGKNYQIKVSNDFSLTENKEYSLSYGVKVTIYADTNVTITVPTSTKIIVKSGDQYNGGNATLTFGKSGAAGTVTFDGKNEEFSEAAFRAEWSSGSYMGHLVINDGVSIKNFKRSQGGTYYGIIYNNGQLDINGGSITNNEISSNTVDSVIFNCRKLNIAGGEISNNSITSYDGYIVMVRGSSAEFTMTGGKIVSNNVRKTVIQLAQDDSSYQGSATITKGTIANNKGYSYSDDDFTADAKDISIGASLTKLTLNGTAEIGTIETNVKNINNSKFITIASGFAPATPISVLVAMSYIGGQVYPSEGMQVATVENGASINGKLVYYNTDFSISDDGKLAGPPEAEYSYSYYNSTEGFVTTTKKGSFQDAVTAIKNSSNAGTIKILADSIDLKQTASFPYETTITSDHDVTFTKGFTGGPMFELPSAGSKNLVSFTADAGYNITIKGANDGDNPVFSMPTSSTGRKLDLTNVTIQDNTVSGNGGAIRLTNDAGVKLTNVTIQHCSAGGYGGAVYHEDCGNNVGGVKCENVIFNNNNAKGGSAIYVDGVTGVSTDECKGLIINGCTFTGNSSTNETASTPAEAVKLDNVIYVDCISGSFNQSVAAELKNTNTFTGNTTYSDINLGSNMATMSNLNKSVKLTDFLLSTDREGGKLKVVVGSYSVSGTAETCVFYTSVLTPDQLNTMAGNFSLTADKSGNGTVLGNKAILPHSTYSNTLTVKELEPKRITFNLNGNKITNCSLSGETVTYNQDDYGKTLPQGSLSMSGVGGEYYAITATPGHTVTFTANLNTGYQVKSVTVAGESGSAVSVTKVDNTTYTFVMPNEKVTVDATVRTSSSITVVQPESGSITVTVPDMTMVGDKFTDVEDGTTVTLSATGDDFVKWSITEAGGTDVTSRLMYPATSKDKSFKMPPYDITITAKVKHDITVNAAGGTYMVVKSTDKNTAITKAAKGDKIWVDLTPNTNYKLTGVTINKAGGETVSYETYYDNNFHDDASLLASGCMVQFYMPDEAVTINVTFELDACAITTNIKNGTISGITSPAAIGSDVSFTLTPTDDTYKLDSYKVFKTGDEATTVDVTESNGTYKFTMPNYPVTVSATFVKKTHDVTTSCTPAEGGKVTIIDKTSPVTVGDSVNINVAANAHYEIEAVTVNSESVTLGDHGDYTFTMPNKDVTISATFKKKQYSVTKTGNNVTFGELNDKYTWGDTVEFTVTPDKWYSVKSVYANDAVVITPVAGKENAYSFTMPQGDVVITAVTERPSFTVTFDSKGGSSITPKTVANGDAADKPGVPVWAGRGFAGWYTDENYTQKYDFATPVTENITLYARWFLWGDVNNDGTVDSYDALLIRRCRAGLTDYSLIENRLAGFVNGFETGRNYPDSADALSIRRYRAGLINRYLVEDRAAGYEYDLENDTYISNN